MFRVLFLSSSIILSGMVNANTGKTFGAVKKRGTLSCGVSQGIAGFSAPDSKGIWRGIDADICRAIAVAVLGNPKKVKYVSLSSQARFTALQSGEVDILSRNTTATLSRDTSLGFNFLPVVFYDGQGFLVHKKDKIRSVKELSGASICVQQGTTTELNLADYFRANRLKMKPIVFESNDEASGAFFKGRCNSLTTDISGLVSVRSKSATPQKYEILPEVISKEPLAPAVRHGDDHWFDVTRWVVLALINAEELGINSRNVEKHARTSSNPGIKRFLGKTKGNGKALGLREDWVVQVIKSVGNYSEIFERNVGKLSPLKIKRGLNALWTKGGLMYAPPFR